uniref:Uncharacterized protein n=1 Tax=Balaenoptera musculus TaxID=9771 RepID=A0A8C0DUV0_BALMU
MASASIHFSEEQVRNVCRALQPPGVSGARWELLVKSMGISIYWQLHQVAVGPLEYIAADCSPELSQMRIQINRKTREISNAKWRNRIISLCFWLVGFPSHQEMEFNGQKVHVILAQSPSMPQFPEKSGVLWVRQFTAVSLICLLLLNCPFFPSLVFMYYFNSLDCPVPNWLFKWDAKVRSQEAGGEVCLTNVDLAHGAVSLKRRAVSALMMLF